MEIYLVAGSLNALSCYYGKKVIILLDEYDTPMQEAYVHGYWSEIVEGTKEWRRMNGIVDPAVEEYGAQTTKQVICNIFEL